MVRDDDMKPRWNYQEFVLASFWNKVYSKKKKIAPDGKRW